MQHRALDVDRFWFRAVVAGEQTELGSSDYAWHVSSGTAAESVLDSYRAEVERANAILAVTPLHAVPARRPVEIFADPAGTVWEIAQDIPSTPAG